MIKLKDLIEGIYSIDGSNHHEDPVSAEPVIGPDDVPNPTHMNSEKGGPTINTPWIAKPRSKFYDPDMNNRWHDRPDYKPEDDPPGGLERDFTPPDYWKDYDPTNLHPEKIKVKRQYVWEDRISLKNALFEYRKTLPNLNAFKKWLHQNKKIAGIKGAFLPAGKLDVIYDRDIKSGLIFNTKAGKPTKKYGNWVFREDGAIIVVK